MDNDLLLLLLSVRLRGGQGVPANADIFKGMKDALALAKEKSLLAVRDMFPLMKSGKPGKKAVQVLDLTPEGERTLNESSDPAVKGASAAGFLQGMRQTLVSDQQALKSEVLDALGKARKPSKPGQDPGQLVKTVAKLEKELHGLAKTLGEVQAKLEKLGSADNPGDPVLDKIDQGFQTLLARVDQALTGFGQTSGMVPVSLPARPAAALPPAGDHASLQTVLRRAYDELCLFIEFQDGLVELPRLFHEAKRALPSLTVAGFHQELTSLWNQQKLELHILNEVREAKEPDKAIHRNDKLYYFVYWPSP